MFLSVAFTLKAPAGVMSRGDVAGLVSLSRRLHWGQVSMDGCRTQHMNSVKAPTRYTGATQDLTMRSSMVFGKLPG